MFFFLQNMEPVYLPHSPGAPYPEKHIADSFPRTPLADHDGRMFGIPAAPSIYFHECSSDLRNSALHSQRQDLPLTPNNRRSWGHAKIAFDHENGNVIPETNFTAETRGTVEDLHHESFCRE